MSEHLYKAFTIDRTKKGSNKSKTYLLPLLDGYIQFDRSIITKVKNTYLYLDNSEIDEDKPILGLLFKKDSLTLDDIQLLQNSKSYKTKIISDTETLFVFNFPKEHVYDYYKFIDGNYSSFDDYSKLKIIKFLEFHYFNYPLAIQKVRWVFDKDPKFKSILEEQLNMYIPSDSELLSKPVSTEETYYSQI